MIAVSAAEQCEEAAKVVAPANTKNSNLAAWMTECNQSHPDDPVLNDLFCTRYGCKWLCLFASTNGQFFYNCELLGLQS